jgi:hypothetical protein
MGVLAPRVADRQPPEVVKPGHRALHDPAVATQARLVRHALARDAAVDAPTPEGAAAAAHGVARVGVPLGGALASPTAGPLARREGGDERREDGRVGALGAGQPATGGGPARSTASWRFVPGLPRAVGFLPVAAPPLSPGRSRCPGWRATSRSGRPRRACPATRGGAPARHPPPARHAAASGCYRCRSQLQRQVVPAHPRLEHEDDPAQRRAIR